MSVGYGPRWGVVLASFAVGALAHAHGNVPSPASFDSPPRLVSMPTDAGDRDYAPYPFASADASFDVAWQDGDSDPLAVHTFYYFDHAPPLALSVNDIAARGTPIAGATAIWGSCSCTPDFGVVCPDLGVRDCRNGFTWDTHALAPGSYFLAAVTHDPPYDIYTVSDGPVRVAHGGSAPPAVIVVRPDGFGTFDKAYTVRWLLAGQAPFHVDLAYALDDTVRAGGAYTPIASDVPLVSQADGSYTYEWDTSQLPSAHIYHVRVTVKDATQQTVFSDSRAGVTVFHPGDQPDLGSRPQDLSVPGEDEQHGCSVGEADPGTSAWRSCVLVALILAGIALVARRSS